MMARGCKSGAPLPMILIMDMDNDVEEFIIFNPPSELGKPGCCTKIREGLSLKVYLAKLSRLKRWV
jgi:hypothetical protein